MRKNIVGAIFKKEMIDILRDKKTLFMMIVLPIIMYPVLMIFGSQMMMMSINSMEQKELPIAFSQAPSELIISKINQGKEDQGKLKIVEVKDYKEALEQREITAYIEIIQENEFVNYKLYINSSIEDSSTASRRIKDILEEYKEELVKEKVKAEGLDIKAILEPITYETINTAKDEEMAGYLLGQILPLILIMGVLMGAMYPAIDVMAGEKERGTLETLLTLPISNIELIMGKYLAVSVSAIVTALLNILSIVLSLGFLVLGVAGADQLGMGNINVGELILPLIITLICICLFAMVIAAISMCVCSLAKNFKEAQNYMTPIMLIGMIPSYASMIPNVELNAFTATIPIVNISLLIKSVLTFRYDIATIAIVLVTNVAFVLLSGFVLSKMFNSEDILFGTGKGFSFLEKRSNIKKGTLPTLSDGTVLFAVLVLLSIYIGSLIQVKFGLMGVAGTQLIILVVPLLFGYYIRADFKKVFAIKLPRLKHLLGGIILWAGGFIIAMLVAQFLLHLFPQDMKLAEALTEFLIGDKHILVVLISVAILPAICEEVFFRGFLVTAFKNKNSNRRAIILSSILFGLMHIDFIRIVPTAILGIGLSYVVCKTGSLVIPMLMHFLNNAIIILGEYYPEGVLGEVQNTIRLDFTKIDFMKLGGLLGVSIILIIVAGLLLKEKAVNKVNTLEQKV